MNNINRRANSELTDEQLSFQDNDHLSKLTRHSRVCVFIINFQTRSARIDGLG